METLLGHDPRLVVAALSIGGAIIGIFLKEVVVRIFLEERKEEKLSRKIFSSYFDPIESASSDLFWRLNEFLVYRGRDSFFSNRETATKYEKYKFDSTLYRIAALLGWIRAYRREINGFSLNAPDFAFDFENALGSISHALSDGSFIERQRMQALCELWRIDQNFDIRPAEIAAHLDVILQRHLSQHSAEIATGLEADEKASLAKDLAAEISQRTLGADISQSVIDETVERAMQAVSTRESWLYRDFQHGIGDMMIKESSWGTRRFEVIGFREFEEILSNSKSNDYVWIERLTDIIDGLDVQSKTKNDARVSMLKNVYSAIIELTEALEKIQDRRSDNPLLTAARESSFVS
ncbi:hypothetical protein [Minwuia sp.]|uniref:hypothetical protein n=1 Tax=Minwuia sp. TaxID=2493630 RepID=UPI003A94488F